MRNNLKEHYYRCIIEVPNCLCNTCIHDGEVKDQTSCCSRPSHIRHCCDGEKPCPEYEAEMFKKITGIEADKYGR